MPRCSRTFPKTKTVAATAPTKTWELIFLIVDGIPTQPKKNTKTPQYKGVMEVENEHQGHFTSGSQPRPTVECTLPWVTTTFPTQSKHCTGTFSGQVVEHKLAQRNICMCESSYFISFVWMEMPLPWPAHDNVRIHAAFETNPSFLSWAG